MPQATDFELDEQSGVHLRNALDDALRSMTEAELRLALASGALDDLLDEPPAEHELEY